MLEGWAVLTFGVLAAVATSACTWFAVRLHWTSGGDWRHSELGRHTMSLAIVLAGLLLVANPLLRGLPGRTAFLLIGTFGLTAVLVHRVILMERTQRSVRDAVRQGRDQVSNEDLQ